LLATIRLWLHGVSDGRLLAAAIILTIPLYVLVSAGYGLSAGARLKNALDSLPPPIVEALPESAKVGWSVRQLLDPQVDDAIRSARAQLQRKLDGASGAAALDAADAAKVRGVLTSGLTVGFLARALGYEQFICYILTVWTMLMISRRWTDVTAEENRLAERPVDLQPGEIVYPDDAVRLEAEVLSFEDPPRGPSALSRTLFSCLRRFETSRDVAAVEAVVRAQTQSIVEEIDSGLSLSRFAAWAVPSVGFIGTVRGIGQALSLADSPNNLPDIVGFLAVAFDTTLIALLLSIAMMLAMHLFQKAFESYASRVSRRCEELLVSHLSVPLQQLSRARSQVSDGVAAR